MDVSISDENTIQTNNISVEVPSTSSSKQLRANINTNTINGTIDEVDVSISDLSTFANNNDTTKELSKKLDDANKKLERANAIIRKTVKANRILLQRLRQSRNINKLSNGQTLAQDLLHTVFHNDQIKYLEAKYRKGRRTNFIHEWADETIKKALRLKHACGDNGYKELLSQSIPLPSTRTLRRRLECITFKDNICNEVFDLLKEKVSNFPDERYKDSMICLDEMSITPGEQIDPSTKHTIGYATIPNSLGKSFN